MVYFDFIDKKYNFKLNRRNKSFRIVRVIAGEDAKQKMTII
jgi:hypothetical protein